MLRRSACEAQTASIAVDLGLAALSREVPLVREQVRDLDLAVDLGSEEDLGLDTVRGLQQH